MNLLPLLVLAFILILVVLLTDDDENGNMQWWKYVILVVVFLILFAVYHLMVIHRYSKAIHELTVVLSRGGRSPDRRLTSVLGGDYDRLYSFIEDGVRRGQDPREIDFMCERLYAWWI